MPVAVSSCGVMTLPTDRAASFACDPEPKQNPKSSMPSSVAPQSKLQLKNEAVALLAHSLLSMGGPPLAMTASPAGATLATGLPQAGSAQTKRLTSGSAAAAPAAKPMVAAAPTSHQKASYTSAAAQDRHSTSGGSGSKRSPSCQPAPATSTALAESAPMAPGQASPPPPSHQGNAEQFSDQPASCTFSAASGCQARTQPSGRSQQLPGTSAGTPACDTLDPASQSHAKQASVPYSAAVASPASAQTCPSPLPGASAPSSSLAATCLTDTANADIQTLSSAVAACKLGLSEQLQAAIATCVMVAHARDAEGRTCLHYAAGYGQEECVDILLAKGADPCMRDANGDVPLHFASIHGHPMCAYNIAKAAPSSCLVRNVRGQMPIDVAVACERGEVLNAMLLACAGDGSDFAVTAMSRLLRDGAVPDTWAPNGSSALMLAAAADGTSALKVLLEHGATIELQDALGRSALMFAAGNCAIHTLEALLDAGACIAQRDRRLRSVLDYAPEGSQVRTVLLRRLAALEAVAAQRQADLLAALESDDLLGPAGATGAKAATSANSAKNKKKAAKKAAKKTAAKAQAQAALLGAPAAAPVVSVAATEDGDEAGVPTGPDQDSTAAVSCATIETSPAAGAPVSTLNEPAEPQVQLEAAAEAQAQSPASGPEAGGASLAAAAVPAAALAAAQVLLQAPEPCSPATCSACDDCQQTSPSLPEALTLGSRNAPLTADGAGVVSKAVLKGTVAAKQAAQAAAAFAVGAEAAAGPSQAAKQTSEPVGVAEVGQKGREGTAAVAAPELAGAEVARVGKEGQAQHQRELLLRWGLDALTEQDEEQDGAWQVVGGRPHRKATGAAPATPAGAHAAHAAHAAAHHAHSAHPLSGHNWSLAGFARAGAGKVGHSGRRSLDIAVAPSTGASSPAPSSATSCVGSVVGLAPSAGKPQRTGSGHSLSSLGSCESAPAGLYAGAHHGHALHTVMHGGAGHEGLGPAGGLAGTSGGGGATVAAKGGALMGAGTAPAVNVWRRRLSMTEAPHGINASAGPAPAASQAAAVPPSLPGSAPWGAMMMGGLDPAPAPAAASAGVVVVGLPDSSGGHDTALAACSAAVLLTPAAGLQPQQGKAVAPQGKAQGHHPAALHQHGGKPPPSSPGLPLSSNWASKSSAASDRKATAAASSSTPSTHVPTPPTHPSTKELQLTPCACDDQHDTSAQAAPVTGAVPGTEATAGLLEADAAADEREAAEAGAHAGAAADSTPLSEQGQAAARSRKAAPPASLRQQEQVQEPPAAALPSAPAAQGHATLAASSAQGQAIPAHLAAELARLRSEAKTLRSALLAATSGQQQQQERQVQAEASGSWRGACAASVSAAEAAAAAVAAAAAAGAAGGSVSVLELERRLAERDALHTANLAAVMQAAVMHAQEEAEKAVAAERLRFVTHMLSAGLNQDLVLSILNSMAPATSTSATLPSSSQLPQGSQGGANRRAYGLAPDSCGAQDREGSSPARVPEVGAAKGRGARSRGQSSGAADPATSSSGSVGSGRRSVEGANGVGATQVSLTDPETSAQQSAATLGAHAAKTKAVSAVAAAAAAAAQACATGRGGGAPASTVGACASSGSGAAAAAAAAAAASGAGAARGGPSGASASAAAAESDDDLLVAALSLAGTCSLRSPSAAIAAARASASSFYMPSRAPAPVPMSLPPSLLRPSPLGLADWAADPSASACDMAASVSAACGPDSAITAAAALAGASMYSAYSSHHQAEGDVEGDSELPACGDISAMLDMSDEEDDPISLGILHSSCGAGPGTLAAEAAAGDAEAAVAAAGGSSVGTGDSARCPGISGGTGGGAAVQGAQSRPGGLSGGELVSGSLCNWLPAPPASQASSAAASEPVGIPLASPVGTLCGAEASGNSFSRCSSMALSGSPLHLTSLPGSSWGAVGSQGGSMCGGGAMAGHSLLSGATLPLPPTSLASGILGSTGAFTTGVGPLGKSLGRPVVGLAFGAVMGGALPSTLGAVADLGCAAGVVPKPALAQPWRITAAAASAAGLTGTLPPAPQPPRARQQQLQHSSNTWGSDELELPEFL